MSKPTAPRVSKTPRQRAEEALAVEDRRVKRLSERLRAINADLDQVREELNRADRRRDYLAAHPDLADPGADVAAGRGRWGEE